jgi:AraC-like DNA-binding protein
MDVRQFTAIDSGLPVSFHLQRCGVSKGHLNDVPASYPSAVIGQARGGRVWMRFPGGVTKRVPSCAGYVIPTGLLLSAWNEGPHPSVYRWSHVRFTLFGAMDLFQVVDVPYFTSRAVGDEIGAINEEHTEMLEGPDPFGLASIARRQELGFKVLRLILKNGRLREGAQELLSGHARIQPALDYMQAHLAEPVARGELARTLFLSESRFHDVFKSATGVAPLQYLQNLRLRRSQELLLTPDLSIAEVGRRCGFPDQFHFSRQFRSAFGTSPRQYRESARRAMNQSAALQKLAVAFQE